LAFLLPTTLKRYFVQIFAKCQAREIKGMRKNGFYSIKWGSSDLCAVGPRWLFWGAVWKYFCLLITCCVTA